MTATQQGDRAPEAEKNLWDILYSYPYPIYDVVKITDSGTTTEGPDDALDKITDACNALSYECAHLLEEVLPAMQAAIEKIPSIDQTEGQKALSKDIRSYMWWLARHDIDLINLLERFIAETGGFARSCGRYLHASSCADRCRDGSYDITDIDQLLYDIDECRYYGFDDAVAALKKRLCEGQIAKKREENKND